MKIWPLSCERSHSAHKQIILNTNQSQGSAVNCSDQIRLQFPKLRTESYDVFHRQIWFRLAGGQTLQKTSRGRTVYIANLPGSFICEPGALFYG